MKLKIMCTGEIEVDFHDLKDLQLTESGKSLKATSPEKINKLSKSLKEYGIVNNLQVWKSGKDIYCFDAHHRKKALLQLEKEGLEIPLLPATRCLAKTKDEAKKLLFLKESSNSWIDTSVVEDYLKEIDFDIEEAKSVIEIPDFDWPEEKKENKNDPNKIPDEPKKIVIKKGDLIELGSHRLLCGDSIIKEDVEKLMDSAKADMVFTDPPYGVAISNTKGKIKGDKNLFVFNECIPVIKKYSSDDSHIYIYFGVQHIVECMKEIKKHFKQTNLIINRITHENKPSPKGYFKNNYEVCFFSNEGMKEFNSGLIEVSNSTLNDSRYNGSGFLKEYKALNDDIKATEHNARSVHPTQKTVEIGEYYINISSKKNQIVLDFFIGSGTTLVACEKTNRHCSGIELEEIHCQTTIQRWCDYTEKTEIKINGVQVNWNDYINQ